MLSRDEVKHIALLARIGIKEEEIEMYQEKLSSILDFFQDLQKADIEEVEVMSQTVGRENRLRSDRVEACDVSEQAGIVDNFPEKHGQYLKVKAVF